MAIGGAENGRVPDFSGDSRSRRLRKTDENGDKRTENGFIRLFRRRWIGSGAPVADNTATIVRVAVLLFGDGCRWRINNTATLNLVAVLLFGAKATPNLKPS